MLLAIAVAAMVPGGAAAIGPARQPATYENAQALFAGGDHRGAIVELKRFLKSGPESSAARLLIGRAMIRVGRGRSAEEQLGRAALLGADGDSLAVALARSYILQGKLARLLADFPARRRSPEIEANLAFARGLAHYALRQFDAADREFAATLGHDPGHVGARLGRIRVLIARFHLDEAASLAADVARLAPAAPDPWYLIGEIARLRGDGAGALAAYGKALGRAASHVPARIARAAVLIDAARPREAMADIEAVSAIAPTDPQSALLRALVLAKDGRASEAGLVLRRLGSAIDRWSGTRRDDDPSRTLLVGVVNHARGVSDDSPRALSRYLASAPHHGAARILIGRILAQRGDVAGAIATLRPVLATAPDDPDHLGLLGDLLMRAGRHGEAAAAFEAALGRSPASRPLRRRLTLSRLASGRGVASRPALDDLLGAIDPVRGGVLVGLLQLGARADGAALTTARSISARRPAAPFAQNLAGIAHTRLGAGDKALRHFAQARALDATYVPALYNLAAAATAAGDHDTARALYRRVLESVPGDGAAMIELSLVAQRAGDLATAIDWMVRAREVDNRVSVTLALGDLYLRAGRPAAALRVVAPAERRRGRDKRLVEAEARAHIAAGDDTRAIALYRDVSSAETGDAGRLDRIARVQLRLGDAKGAAFTHQTAVALDPANHDAGPGDHAARRALAFAAIRAGRLKRAKLLHEALIAASPGDAVVLNNLAWLSARLGDADALSYARRAHASRPDDPAVLDTYAMILAERGAPGRGLELLRRARRQLIGDARLGYHVAVVLNRLGRRAEARAELEAVLGSGRPFAEARAARRLLRDLGGA